MSPATSPIAISRVRDEQVGRPVDASAYGASQRLSASRSNARPRPGFRSEGDYALLNFVNCANMMAANGSARPSSMLAMSSAPSSL